MTERRGGSQPGRPAAHDEDIRVERSVSKEVIRKTRCTVERQSVK